LPPPAGEVKGGSPTGGQRDSILRNEPKSQGSDWLEINVIVGVTRIPLEAHHVVKRAQGGSDFDLDRLVALCPPCHAQTDAPYARDRLVVMPSDSGRFIFQICEGTGKETSQVVERWESPGFPRTMEPARVLATTRRPPRRPPRYI
jgi:HNH endonuclease